MNNPPEEGRPRQELMKRALSIIGVIGITALIAFLAETFSLPKSAVEVTAGQLSRSKVFLLRGVTLSQVEARLAAWTSKI